MSKNNTVARLKITLLLMLAGLVVTSFTTRYDDETEAPAPKVKKIILLIGDGMGIAQVSGAMTLSDDKLFMTTANHIGFIKTHSWDDYVTDSAAGGTAISSGKKTKNGMIGMSPDSIKVDLITELVRKQKKMSYGVVSTSAVTHATPASFVAHNINRSDYESIALDFVRNKPDVFIGGGKLNFVERRDKRNLVNVLENDGYDVVYNIEELKNTNARRVAGLLADTHMPPLSEGRGYVLAEATQKAIELLDRNRRGFFLMVEGSQIDWGGHAKDAQYALEETLDFDLAVGVALKFAAEDKNTLVIVTADHETGGMTISGGDLENNSVIAHFSSAMHTGVIVPVFAFGAGAEEFTGFYENTGLFNRMSEALKLR